ncbi:hypothetical protein GCM10008018_40700 [Paenibacillus marchantiophytorum]|uniref:Core domain-containing protein n=1 Tax=Paenibacillus marchantiophytorum TaxID=1619310 RepID=A0ABQ1EWD0_9BACL|nr:iron-sulfur cluster biosynthesis family protein [Paenibacillus marchantiophytorum]GFZ90304.1 hypothetical protein GCM10008018_40700 [Paenibacillus marchantiophytorum]
MNVTFTDTAIDRIAPLLQEDSVLNLVFDTEDCGCSVNGVPTLWIVPKANEEKRVAETNQFKLTYKAKDEIFFEEKMTIDFHDKNKSYILKSNNQIYNAGMSLVDKR